MTNYSQQVQSTLSNIISDMADYAWLFSRCPGSHFSRKRKLDFETTMNLILSMEGQSMNLELLNYFDFSTNTPSVSALNQQRGKLLPETFEFLFKEFNDSIPLESTYKGFHLLDCDGSDINIAHNPKDIDNYFPPKDNTEKGYNQIHLNALYDLCSRRYVDAIIQPGVKNNEPRALCDMIDRYDKTEKRKTIIIADRGYSAYNVYAHAIENGMYFLIRAKDYTSVCSTLSTYGELPDTPEFDIEVGRYLTRSRGKKVFDQPMVYKRIKHDTPFDYLGPDHPKLYYIKFRVVRFRLSDGSYECIVTNLPKYLFPMEEIKKLYHFRWKIETSFRELKYTIGLVNFHSKKLEYVKQEVFLRLILYNFCEIITSHVVINDHNRKKQKKYAYQVNYSMAIRICKRFLKATLLHTLIDAEALIKKYVQPIRPNRHYERKVRGQSFISFSYRIA